MMRINEIIKEKRLEKGYTQEQMAELFRNYCSCGK